MYVICVILTLSEKLSRVGIACNICNIDFVKKLADGVMHVICVIRVILTLSEKISRVGNACNICNIDFVKKLAEGVMHVICVIG